MNNSQCAELMFAIKEGNFPTVRDLLLQGVSPDCVDESEHTALEVATSLRKVNIVRILVEHGATVDDKIDNWLTVAACGGDLEILRFFVKESQYEDKTLIGDALISASSWGHSEVAAFLIEGGTNVDYSDESGNTPLIQAVMQGRLFTVECLLRRGASVDFAPVTSDGTPARPAIHWAIQEDYVDIVQILIQYGVNIESEDESGITALCAAASAGSLEMIVTLLDAGADVNGNKSQVPLINATAWEREDVVEILISRGVDINALDKDGDTALSYAASSGNDRMVRFLLEIGASVQTRNGFGRTAMEEALVKGHNNIVRLLKAEAR